MNHEHLYEKTPPLKLFFKVSIPSIISMVMASLFLVVDGILVGQLLGGDALASITLVFPLVIFAFAIGDLVGVGSSVPISIALGEKDEQTASEIFTFSCIFIIVLGFFLEFYYFYLVKSF